MNRIEATQYIKATLTAFGPDEAISMTKETWAKLHEAMKALAEQPAQRKPLTDDEFISMVDSAGIAIDPGLAFEIKEMVEAAHGIKGDA